MYISLTIWNKYAPVNFQRIQLALALQVRGIFFRKFVCAYLVQIASKII